MIPKDHLVQLPRIVSYSWTFPTTIDTKQVQQVVHAIASRPYGSAPVGFEVWSTTAGYTFRLRLPYAEAEYITTLVQTLMPGVSFTPETVAPQHMWSDVAELSDTEPGRTFNVRDPEAISAGLLAALQVHTGEYLLWQVVIAPPVMPYALPAETKPPRTNSPLVNVALNHLATPKDELDDRREKLKMLNLVSTTRIAVRAATPPQVNQLIGRVQAALGAVHGHNRFRRLLRRPVDHPVVLGRLVDATLMPSSNIQLREDEAVPLLALPIGEPFIQGLPQSRARRLLASEAVARQGIVVADSNVPGRERPIALTSTGMTMNTYVSGPVGTGKTVAMANIFAQFVAAGGGALVIETKGEKADLFHKALNYIPAHRVQDAILIDVTDTQWPAGFNILEQGNPQVVASSLDTLFEAIYGSSGVRMPAALYHGVMTLMTTTSAPQPMTIVDLPILYAPRSSEEGALAQRLIEGVSDPEIRRWWHSVAELYKTPNRRADFFEPINQRLWQISSRSELRNIFGQSQSSFDFFDAIANNKIILVNLVGFGRQMRNLLGAILCDLFWGCIKGRAARQPFALFLDEFQNFPTFALEVGNEMLSEGRAFNLCAVYGNQGVSQLAPRLLDAVMNNCRNKFIYQTDSSNARTFMREFGRSVGEDDIVNLSHYEAIGRLVGSAGVSPPLTMKMRPPLPPAGWAHQVRLQSRQKYGRTVDQVVADIRARRGEQDDQPHNQPQVGESEW